MVSSVGASDDVFVFWCEEEDASGQFKSDHFGGVNETVIRERPGKGCRLQQHVFHFSPTAHSPQLQPFSVSQFLFSLGCCLRH